MTIVDWDGLTKAQLGIDSFYLPNAVSNAQELLNYFSSLHTNGKFMENITFRFGNGRKVLIPRMMYVFNKTRTVKSKEGETVKLIPLPNLNGYQFPGSENESDAFPEVLEEALDELVRNSVITAKMRSEINYLGALGYRSGNDHLGWHRDKWTTENTLGKTLQISLGTTRNLEVRKCVAGSFAKLSKEGCRVQLQQGSLWTLGPLTNGFDENGKVSRKQCYKHRIAKNAGATGLRFALTLRTKSLVIGEYDGKRFLVNQAVSAGNTKRIANDYNLYNAIDLEDGIRHCKK